MKQTSHLEFVLISLAKWITLTAETAATSASCLMALQHPRRTTQDLKHFSDFWDKSV